MPDSFKRSPQDEALRAAIEAALKPGAPLLRLSPTLEERYEAATWRGRQRGTRQWLLSVCAIDLLWIAIDAVAIPDHLWIGVACRLLLLSTLYGAAAAVLMRQRPAWVLGLSLLVPTVVLSLVTGYLAGFAGPMHAERYNMAALFAAFASTMVPPIPFRFAVVQSALAVLIFTVFQIGASGSFADNIELLTYYPLCVIAALAARRRFERMYRRNFLLALRDELRVEDLAGANSRLTTLSNTDALTGVFNRRHFDRALAEAWTEAVARREWIAVVMVDVDHFKMFNDAAGHAEGDRCLQTVATAIAAQVRGKSDLVARYGGEEFIALLPQADLDGALGIGERIRAAVERLNIVNPGHPDRKLVTVSVGIAAVRADISDASPANVLRAADTALYAAKATGRNYVCGASGTDEASLRPAPADSNAEVLLAPGVSDPRRTAAG
jgi:diguanylate cyclase (GGDEF)-like protein